LADLPTFLRNGLIRKLTDGIIRDKCKNMEASLAEALGLLALSETIAGAPPPYLRKLAAFAFELVAEEFSTCGDLELAPEKLQRFEALLPEIARYGFIETENGLASKLSQLMARQADLLSRELAEPPLRSLIRILQAANRIGLKLEFTRVQNLVYGLLQKELDRFHRELESGQGPSGLERFRLLLSLAHLLQINIETFKESFLNLLLPEKA